MHVKSEKDRRIGFGFAYENNNKVKEREELGLSLFKTEELSSLPVSFSDESNMKIKENKIIYNGTICKTCIIGASMECGVYRITFEKDENKCNYGIIDDSLESKKRGKTISEEHIGCEVGNLINSQETLLNGILVFIVVMIFVTIIFILFYLINGNSESSDKDLSKFNKELDFSFWLELVIVLILIILGVIFFYLRSKSKISWKTAMVFDKDHKNIGNLENIYDGDCFSIELDLRSNELEKRTAHFYVNNSQQKILFYGLPSTVHFGVCFFLIIIIQFFYFILFYFLKHIYSLIVIFSFNY